MPLFRSLFGPSKEEIWQELSRQVGASYVAGGFWNGAKVEARVGPWTVVLDTYTVSTGKSSITYTRLRAPYVNRDGFRFHIYRRTILTEVGKFLGMQDVAIGDPAFDDAFVVKAARGEAQDAAQVKSLLTDPQLRELLQRQPAVSLQVVDDEGFFGPHFDENVDELVFHVVGVIKDIDRLKSLFDLFAETLHRLCAIGSAYETDPNAPAALPPADSLLRPSDAASSGDLLRPAEGSAGLSADELLRPGEPPSNPKKTT